MFIFIIMLSNSPNGDGNIVKGTFQSLVLTEGVLRICHLTRYTDIGEFRLFTFAFN